MALSLEAILFNHDVTSSATSALNVRRDFRTPATLPEWRRSMTHDNDDSPVVYAIEGIAGSEVSLTAQFQRVRPDVRQVEVRAVELASGLPIFGEVLSRPVTFRGDGRGTQTFVLAQETLSRRGVGVYDVIWSWQFRNGGGQDWREFAESRHRIYAVLAVPNGPWLQQPFVATNTQLPWVAVLEHACHWASGARTLEEAAEKVTRAVNGLAPSLVEYACPVLGATQYSWPYFNCSAFLDRLSGGLGNGRYVNCTDCATIVSTFANVLGCELWQSIMIGPAPFELNPILAIGSREWRTACNWGAFTYHEVAWSGDCDERDDVYDACLMVDGDQNPVRAPHRPLLPARIRFGGPGRYRDRLTTPAGRPNCRPLPSARQRRFVI